MPVPRELVAGGTARDRARHSALPRPRPALDDQHSPGDDEVVQSSLAAIRELLRMDVAFIGEFGAGRRVFRYVDAVEEECPVRVGASDPLDATYCQRVVDGRLPQLIADTAALPEAASLSVTRTLPIGAHLSVPITLSDGRVYGTLCAFRAAPDPSLDSRALNAARLVAGLLARHVEPEVLRREVQERATADIETVIRAGTLTTVFQPVVDLETRCAVGYEALTRFPTGRPDEWFARAGSAGLAVPLELAALRAAVRHVDRLPAHAYLAVNLSPAVLASAELADLAPALPMHRLVVELTEQTEVSSYAELGERVRWLRTLGGRLAVDDAGSGYAGLQRILALAPDVLKLDLELVRGVATDPARQALATAMTWFARRTGAALVAEGVETGAEAEMLSSLGVRYGQGFHLGRPGGLP